MGDFNPEAQVKGFDGASFIALICNKCCAIFAEILSFVIMAQRYKVFFNQSVIFLCDSVPEKADENKIFVVNTQTNFNPFIQRANQNDGSCQYLLSENPEKVWQAFQKHFEIRIAAGGLVTNTLGQILFIFRKGLWDLPKGHVHRNEPILDGAVREVTEECGIEPLLPGELLTITYHTYELDGKSILKYSYWYNMLYEGNQTPVPQTDEGITVAEWVNADKVQEKLENAYPSICEIFRSL